MNSREIRSLQEAYLEVYQKLDEAEGSYGQTPRATANYGALVTKRRETPASEYSQRGEKKKKVDAASRHMSRSQRTAADHRGKKSTQPAHHSWQRSNMTPDKRTHLRGQDEYGHTAYNPDDHGPASGPGGIPKGKKLARQKKTGVSAESYDIYDIILSHLLDEGYAETAEAAEAIMVNMSEGWIQSIIG